MPKGTPVNQEEWLAKVLCVIAPESPIREKALRKATNRAKTAPGFAAVFRSNSRASEHIGSTWAALVLAREPFAHIILAKPAGRWDENTR
jgi:hypothetical protein